MTMKTGAAMAMAVFLLAAFACAPGAARAHPHIWIDARAVLQFDGQGRLEAIGQDWQFDEMFGAYATQGRARGKDGSLSPSALRAMTEEWMGALGHPMSHYFTTVAVDGQRQGYGPPRESAVRWKPRKGPLSLSFVLPLAQPVAVRGRTVTIDIFDPTYFVAYDFRAPGAVAMRQAPEGCRTDYRPPNPPDWQTLQKLSSVPADADGLPEELYAITKGMTHRIEVICEP